MNKTKRILSAFLILYSLTNFAQTIKFRRVIGNSGYDYGNSAMQTADKGYIIGGTTSSFGAGSTDMYVIKTDSLGTPYKQATFGGINVEAGNCIRQTADKGYIIAGYTNSFGAGGYDVYLVKMDSNLNEQWSKTYGGSDWDFGKCVAQTTDGGYIICGGTYSYGQGDEDYYLIKTNSTGDTLWTKTFGGTHEDIANSVIQTSDGGYILTGTTKSMGDTLGDFYTIKTDSSGNTQWTNKFGGPLLDYANDILESRYGGYIVGGESQSYGTAGSSDGIIVKIDPTGSFASLVYQTYLPGFDNIESVAEDTSGRVAMTGRTVTNGDSYGNGDVFFSMINKSWGFINATTFGYNGYDIGYSIEATKDHGFIICGYTNSFNNNLADIYLIKTDTIGYSTSSDINFVTGIETNYILNNAELKVYPNPANNNIYINFKNNTINPLYNISVTDILGKELKHLVIESKTLITINTSDLADGLYFINVTDKDFSTTQKLIVHH